jgi:hypothetical protein
LAWEDALNLGPKLAVVGILILVFGAASYFLDKYVITATHNIAVFIVGSYVVFSSYFTFNYYLNVLSSSYQQIEEDKKFYVLSNLMKSGLLLSYTPLAYQVLYQTMVEDIWDSKRIQIMGTLYAIPDFVSLFMVKRMAKSTIAHHVCVCIFNWFSVSNDYSHHNIMRSIVIYAIFSVFAYLVNLLLASRFLNVTNTTSAVLSALALLIYASCCFLNWSWQVWYISFLATNFHHYSIWLFVAAICFIVYDDLILMKWLYKNALRKLTGGKSKLKEGQ